MITLPDGTAIDLADASCEELEDALSAVEGERDEWDGIAIDISDELDRRAAK